MKHYLSLVSFEVVGYGCMTCIGNSGPLPEPVVEAITQVNTDRLFYNYACCKSGSVYRIPCYENFSSQGDLVAAGVLSGNRNFEGRVHPNTRANYLASPPLVIAYALAGTVRVDFEKEPVGE